MSLECIAATFQFADLIQTCNVLIPTIQPLSAANLAVECAKNCLGSLVQLMYFMQTCNYTVAQFPEKANLTFLPHFYGYACTTAASSTAFCAATTSSWSLSALPGCSTLNTLGCCVRNLDLYYTSTQGSSSTIDTALDACSVDRTVAPCVPPGWYKYSFPGLRLCLRFLNLRH
jgi:hypothetical protein